MTKLSKFVFRVFYVYFFSYPKMKIKSMNQLLQTSTQVLEMDQEKDVEKITDI